MPGEKFLHTEGTVGKSNDVYMYYTSLEEITQHVVFFPGDVQEFYQEMTERRDTRWKDFCFENCAKWLSEKFKGSCIWTIKASRLHLNTFACYENFLRTNEFGMPQYDESGLTAWKHLKLLLQRLLVKCFPKEELETIEKLPIKLVSFSKGCVVLNQLLHELPVLVKSQQDGLLDNIHTLCWLDNGVPGNSGAWLTKETCIQLAAERIPALELHTTPYQMNDALRPWISKEKKRFVQLLRKHTANFQVSSYFDDETAPPSLKMHFELLKSFNSTF